MDLRAARRLRDVPGGRGANHTIALRGPEGNVKTIPVDPSAKLGDVKVGDDVVVRHTQATAIAVQK
jgi:hypothetical protein